MSEGSLASNEISIRAGQAADVMRLADAFREMWLDNGFADAMIEPDYRERVERFVREGQAGAELEFFLAERDGEMLGAACCQLFQGLYPAILRADVRRYGYVWGVYVAPGARRAGLGKRLTERCVQALRAMGCTHVLLHAAPSGRGIYQRLGFENTNEMRLVLSNSV